MPGVQVHTPTHEGAPPVPGTVLTPPEPVVTTTPPVPGLGPEPPVPPPLLPPLPDDCPSMLPLQPATPATSNPTRVLRTERFICISPSAGGTSEVEGRCCGLHV